MNTEKITIDLDYIRPNSKIIYPLLAENNKVIIPERIPLTRKTIQKLKAEYGHLLYYVDTGDKAAVSRPRIEKALNTSRHILDEITSTEKLSAASFKEAEQVIEEILTDMKSSEFEAIYLLNELKDHNEYLYTHSVNVGILTAIFLKLLKKHSHEEIKYITLGAYLHDIGSMKIDKNLLLKASTFSESEKQKIMIHPQKGYELIKGIPGINPLVLQPILFHHERFDDNGYYSIPYENLPLAPKIISLGDVYDALTSKRSYRDALSPQISMKTIFNLVGNQFEYNLVHFFVNKIYPLLENSQAFYAINDLCELNTNEIAIIQDFGIFDYLTPKVMVFCKFQKTGGKMSVKYYDRPVEIDLHQDHTRSIKHFITEQKVIDAIRIRLVSRKLL